MEVARLAHVLSSIFPCVYYCLCSHHRKLYFKSRPKEVRTMKYLDPWVPRVQITIKLKEKLTAVLKQKMKEKGSLIRCYMVWCHTIFLILWWWLNIFHSNKKLAKRIGVLSESWCAVRKDFYRLNKCRCRCRIELKNMDIKQTAML